MAPSMAVACVLVSVGLAVGQVLFKLAAQDIASQRAEWALISVFSPWLVAALAVYGVTTVLWVWILMHVPLSKAYPFALFGVALVPLAGYWFFSEALSLQYAAGLALVAVGLVLIHTG